MHTYSEENPSIIIHCLGYNDGWKIAMCVSAPFNVGLKKKSWGRLGDSLGRTSYLDASFGRIKSQRLFKNMQRNSKLANWPSLTTSTQLEKNIYKNLHFSCIKRPIKKNLSYDVIFLKNWTEPFIARIVAYDENWILNLKSLTIINFQTTQ